ncbi:hypothetical protein CKAH01_14053 [Colletotrichum kahawae]|uniref:Uncharacterized protein n=1 Tax=Colletotrichum kahawae TaxID=34407 RepID=A0AAD9YQQ9_COLKA|nr:hypothetical protein CKAH01_14053 [Colletotrichum kahawae]
MANREVGFGRVGAPLVLAVLVDDQWERATPEERHRDFPRAPAFLLTHGGHPGAQTWQRVSALASALALGLRCFLLFWLFASFPHFPSRFHRRPSFPGPATWIAVLGVDWIHWMPDIASALIGALLLAAESPRRACGNENMSSVWRHPWPLLRGYGTMETSKHLSEALLLLPKGRIEGDFQRQDNGRFVKGPPSSQTGRSPFSAAVKSAHRRFFAALVRPPPSKISLASRPSSNPSSSLTLRPVPLEESSRGSVTSHCLIPRYIPLRSTSHSTCRLKVPIPSAAWNQHSFTPATSIPTSFP